MCTGVGLLTYWFLGSACSGIRRRTSGWGSLLLLPDEPHTTAPLPCNYGSFRLSGTPVFVLEPRGVCATIRPHLRHGVLEIEVPSVPYPIPN